MRNLGLIVLLFVLLFPALEIYTMFQLADVIGWWLLAWLLASAMLGSALIRSESMAAVSRLAMTAQKGHSPFVAIWQSGRNILAGMLLIFPGVISDAIALILLLWPGRPVRAGKAPVQDDGIIEGEAYVVEAEKIEIKSDRH